MFVSNKNKARVQRWNLLNGVLRSQLIDAIKIGRMDRAATVLRRLNVVRLDNNTRNARNGFIKSFVPLTLDSVVETLKSKNLI